LAQSLAARMIDISTPIHGGMTVWPGDAPVQVVTEPFEHGQLTSLAMSAHTGTHIDAPLHFIAGGLAIDQMPLEAMVGACQVIAVDDPVAIRPAHLPPLAPGARVLFKTANSAHEGAFREDFVYLSADAARQLVDAGVRTVGIDYLSIGGFHHDLVETHRVLLGAGVWVIEGLRLAHVEPGAYQLICLPLKIAGADGAPARALLQPL
jgi:arylformamidase